MRKPAAETQPGEENEVLAGLWVQWGLWLGEVRGSIRSFWPAVAGTGFIRVPAVGSAAGCAKHLTASFLAEHCCL